ncbi:MAG: lamin tail domain-containing protein [Patescibacteria group bacterium]
MLLLSALFPAVTLANVVISELLWSGSDLSSSDEWIELANTGTGDVALDGWRITKLSNGEEVEMLTFPQGTVAQSGGYFLISNKGESESRLGIAPDLITTSVSLVNTQLLLRLYNALGELIDAVDDGVGAPFAGSNDPPKASMERIALSGSGQLKENWQTATTFLHFDDGAPLFGTPRAQNGTGPSQDTVPPHEATLLSAEVMNAGSGLDSGSGEATIFVTWVPSTSLDLLEQELSVSPAIAGTSQWLLPQTATGITLTEGIGSGIGFTFTLKSRDTSGNTSSGVSTISKLFPEVKITEVLANPIGADDEEWIEIGNLGPEAVDIAGWILDEGNSSNHYVIAPRRDSSFTLIPGEHVAFGKEITGLPLDNQGEMVSLKRGSISMDEWRSIETAEEVSYGKDASDSNIFRSFCVPTRGNPNIVTSSNPRIVIQSGESVGVAKVTLNLIAEVETGSTLHALCHFDYGDGHVSESCNPPSHTIATVGTYAIRLRYTDFCLEVSERTLTATVGSLSPPAPTETPPPSSSGGGGSRGHGGSSGGGRTSCEPGIFDGVLLSEALPNPDGDDAELEWIELENTHNTEISLCGWQLDDGSPSTSSLLRSSSYGGRAGQAPGSKPHHLDSYSIPPQSFLLLPRTVTKIALNNTNESIRLIAPNDAVQEIAYTESTEGESYARRTDGVYVFTPFPTPGDTNRFREAGTVQQASVIIAAALPNPDGRDEGNEWVELENTSDHAADLRGWTLGHTKGGTPFALDGIIMRPLEIVRLMSRETNVALVNTEDAALLRDPGGTIASLLAWQDAASGQVYRPISFADGVQAKIIAVIDGDTIDVEVKGKKEHVRLLGIDTPETVHPWKPLEKFGEEARETLKALLKDRVVTLHFESTTRDKYGRILAYVILNDGLNVNGELVRRGLARAYLRYPFGLAQLFASYEEEARRNKWGLWADDKTVEFVVQSDDIPEEIRLGEGTGTLLLASTVLQETGAFLSQEQTGPWGHVFISEVMSNPPAPRSPEGEGGPKEGPLVELGEYLELWNPEPQEVNLEGWILDDAIDASSKPQKFPEGTIIPAGGFLALSDKALKISLNNEGEALSLSAPDGTLIASVTYPKLERGEAYALKQQEWPAGRSSLQASEGWCITRLPTPGKETICRTPIVATKKKSEKSPKKEKVKSLTATSLVATQTPLSTLKTIYRIELRDEGIEGKGENISPLLTRAGVQKEQRDGANPLFHHLFVMFAILCSFFGVIMAKSVLQ